MQLASERLNMHFFFNKLKTGRVRRKLLWEDDTVMDILEFDVADGTRNNVLQRRILEKM